MQRAFILVGAPKPKGRQKKAIKEDFIFMVGFRFRLDGFCEKAEPKDSGGGGGTRPKKR